MVSRDGILDKLKDDGLEKTARAIIKFCDENNLSIFKINRLANRLRHKSRTEKVVKILKDKLKNKKCNKDCRQSIIHFLANYYDEWNQLQFLIKVLDEEDDGFVRQLAAEYLGKNNRVRKEEIKKALSDDHEMTRICFIGSLSINKELSPDLIKNGLFNALEEESNELVILEIIQALIQLYKRTRDKSIAEKVWDFIQTKKEGSRVYEKGLEKLESVYHPQSKRILENRRDQEAREVIKEHASKLLKGREDAFNKLIKLSQEERRYARLIREELIPSLISDELFNKDCGDECKANIIRLLGYNSKHLTVLVKLLTNESPVVREAVVRELLNFKREGINLLINSLNDPDEKVRTIVVEELSKVKSEKIIPLLFNKFITDSSERVRAAAANGLKDRLLLPDYHLILIKALDSKNDDVKGNAINLIKEQALTEANSLEAIQLLIDSLGRDEAVNSLRDLKEVIKSILGSELVAEEFIALNQLAKALDSKIRINNKEGIITHYSKKIRTYWPFSATIKDERVTELTYPGSGLFNQHLRLITFFRKLKSLIVYDKLDKLSSNISSLTNLESLSLKKGVSELPKSIGELEKLKYLYIEGYSPSTLELTRGAAIPKLERLPESIGGLKNLISLKITGDERNRVLFESLPAPITNLKKLRSLWIEWTELKELPEDISKLRNLKSLYLSCNKLEAIPESILELKKLERLELKNNPGLFKKVANKTIIRGQAFISYKLTPILIKLKKQNKDLKIDLEDELKDYPSGPIPPAKW